MTPIAFSRSLRILTLASSVSVLTGCTANTWERVSPDAKGYRDRVANMTSADRRADGLIVVCVTGKPAATPAFIGDPPDEAFSLILPADAADRVVRDVHLSLRRYDLTAADRAGPCGDPGATAAAPAVYVFITNVFGRAHRNIVYVAPDPRFDGARAVLLQPGPRPVEGNPAYVVVLPFAVVFDVVVSMPLLLFSLVFLNAVGSTS